MKRIISIFTAILIICFTFPSLAAENDSLTWEKAVALFDSSNVTLKKLANVEKQSAQQYVDATITSGGINTDGVKYSFMGEEIFFSFDNYTKMLLTQQKELLPAQMLFSWDMSKDNRLVTRNSLIIALRGIYGGLYSARCDYRTKAGKLELFDSMYKQAELKYKNGLIADIDLEEASYNLFKAKQELAAATRNFENTTRSFNSFVGIDVRTKYTDVLFTDTYNSVKIKMLESYLATALKQRIEISSPERQLEIDTRKKSIMEKNQVHQIYTAVAKDYADLLLDIDSLKTKQEKAKLEIEKDIRNAYMEVVNSGRSVENFKKTLNLQENNFNNMKKKYQAGLISKNTLKQVELAYMEVELGYRMSLLDYNTKLMKLQYAAGAGPGFGG